MDNIRELIIQRVFLKPLGPLRGICAAHCTGFVLYSSDFCSLLHEETLVFCCKVGKIYIQDPPHLLGSLSDHYLLYLECKRNTSERLLRAKEN